MGSALNRKLLKPAVAICVEPELLPRQVTDASNQRLTLKLAGPTVDDRNPYSITL